MTEFATVTLLACAALVAVSLAVEAIAKWLWGRRGR